VPITADQVSEAAERWGFANVVEGEAERLAAYGNLLFQWNARLSLTAIREESELIDRHLMEGVFASTFDPPGPNVLDFGSGTGIPGIPIAVCRGDVFVTLAESRRRKAAFLQEAIRTVQAPAVVHADRAESLPHASFDAVWMRAVDRSERMLPLAAALVFPKGALYLLGSGASPSMPGWSWCEAALPHSHSRVLHIGRRL
jgi:16S rRNA (guanine527-N7)-methyltransferase